MQLASAAHGWTQPPSEDGASDEDCAPPSSTRALPSDGALWPADPSVCGNAVPLAFPLPPWPAPLASAARTPVPPPSGPQARSPIKSANAPRCPPAKVFRDMLRDQVTRARCVRQVITGNANRQCASVTQRTGTQSFDLGSHDFMGSPQSPERRHSTQLWSLSRQNG